MAELWKSIPGFEFYSVSSLGRIKSFRFSKEKLLKLIDTRKSYKKVMLYSEIRIRQVFVHRLVAEVFLDNPNHHPSINHKNGDKADNRIENLEWVTDKQNHEHCFRLGLHHNPKQPVICLNTGNRYESIIAAARDTGCQSGNIYACLIGRQRQTKGYAFRRLD